jgi:hypothetical protein
LGTRDKVDKHDLMDFITRISGIKRSNMGDVNIQKSFSFFEVDANVEKKITNKFNNITLEDGRELRVNRDN